MAFVPCCWIRFALKVETKPSIAHFPYEFFKNKGKEYIRICSTPTNIFTHLLSNYTLILAYFSIYWLSSISNSLIAQESVLNY